MFIFESLAYKHRTAVDQSIFEGLCRDRAIQAAVADPSFQQAEREGRTTECRACDGDGEVATGSTRGSWHSPPEAAGYVLCSECEGRGRVVAEESDEDEEGTALCTRCYLADLDPNEQPPRIVEGGLHP